MAGTSSKKRRDKSTKYKAKNPKRGGPGILITCERGREFKSQREGIELLSHYYYHNSEDNECKTNHDDQSKIGSHGDDLIHEKKKRKQLSLEDEIQMLKGGASADLVLLGDRGDGRKKLKSTESFAPFTNYDTGCCGTVFLMCTAPNTSILTPEVHQVQESSETIDEKTENSSDISQKKAPKVMEKRKFEDPKRNDEIKKIIQQANSIWDPIKVVKLILNEASKPSSHDAPSSRYITRIIPIQATCFASMKEIESTAKFLIDHILLPFGDKNKATQTTTEVTKDTRRTFSVAVKRRNCSNVTRDQIITGIAGMVDDKLFKVDLKDPEFTISIEICRTLCGLSILRNIREYKNFNLFEIRQSS